MKEKEFTIRRGNFQRNEMVTFEPLELISICLIIAAIIVVSPHWLILYQKHRKEILLRKTCQLPHYPLPPPITKPNIPPVPSSRLNQELEPVVPSTCSTPGISSLYPTTYAH